MATIPIINIVEGSSIAALNSLLVLSILSEKTLRQRKELILITGMAIADALYGLGCIDSGRDKFAQLARSNVTDYTPLHCFFKPKELLINYASQTSLLTMIAISGERLTAIVWFNSYGLIPRRYHCSILFLAYFIPMCTMFAGAYQAYLLTMSGRMFTISCNSYSQILTDIIPIFKIALAAISVILYAFVLIAYRMQVGRFATQGNNTTIQMSRSRRLTQTLALITGCTLTFYCIPWTIVIILNSFGIIVLNSFFYMFLPLQYIFHVIVFYWRQQEIRNSIKRLICCKAKSVFIASSNINENRTQYNNGNAARKSFAM